MGWLTIWMDVANSAIFQSISLLSQKKWKLYLKLEYNYCQDIVLLRLTRLLDLHEGQFHDLDPRTQTVGLHHERLRRLWNSLLSGRYRLESLTSHETPGNRFRFLHDKPAMITRSLKMWKLFIINIIRNISFWKFVNSQFYIFWIFIILNVFFIIIT